MEVPNNELAFYHIVNTYSRTELLEIGFGLWDTMNNIIKENATSKYHEPNRPKKKLKFDEDILLFPKDWWKVIPENFVVTGLWGEEYQFHGNETDNDSRFGCLGYGIRRLTQTAMRKKKLVQLNDKSRG